MSKETKPHLNLVVIGHVDHGKSTLTGHLLFRAGFIDEKKLREIEEEAKKRGQESFKFAWLLDRLKEERERGLTIDLSFMRFETKKYYFTIIDAPGHRDFVKNMITGASQADAALLVISAKKGEYEAGMSPEGQTREHVILAKTMGIDQVIVAVNKMDDITVNWSKERFEQIKSEVSKFMRGFGFKVEKIPFIPVSAWTGDNIMKLSSKMPWYKGLTLIEAFDLLEVPPKPIDKPLRIPIQDVYVITGVGTVPVGRVETGILKVGDKVVFMPAGKVGEVRSIEMHHVRIPRALPGDNIGFNVRGVSRKDIRRGHVVGHLTEPPTVAKSFRARVIILWHPTAIAAGYCPVIHAHTASVSCRLKEIVAKIDPRTGKIIERQPKMLKKGEAAVVVFEPIKPMVIEKFKEIPQLGRFAIRDMGRTIGVGVVEELEPVKVEIKTK